MEPLGAVLGASWAALEESSGLLEASWGHLGRILVPPGPSWRRLGAVLGLQNPSDELVPASSRRGGGDAGATPGLSRRIRIIRKGCHKEVR